MTFGDGTCAIPVCVRTCRENELMCRTHWYLVPRPLRSKVWTAYRAWERGYGSLDVLRSVQQEAVDAVTRRSTA